MKKIFLTLILFLSVKGIGQTYTCTINMKYSGTVGLDYEAITSFYTVSNIIYSYDSTIHYNITNTIENIPSYSSYFLNSEVLVPGGSSCQKIKEITAIELMKNNSASASVCGSSTIITNFKPNVTIKNQNLTNTTTVCSGKQLELAGFPIGFPDEAYHWQYSLDNQATWIDVPSSIGSNPKTNDTQITAFSINDLLGSTSEQFFDKIIYFRLGYGQNRPFTDVIPLLYSPCAPVIKNIAFENPKCSSDPMTVNVTFDRNLYDKEELRYFQLQRVDVKIDPKTNQPFDFPPIPYPFISTNDPSNGIVKLFDEKTTNVFTYSLSISAGLEDGGKYKIGYQAFLDGNPKGVPKSNEDFTYTKPSPFYFTATATSALCNNADGAIEILAWGGSGTYKYQLDGKAEAAFNNPETIIEGTISKQKVIIDASSKPNPNPLILTNHAIKVTDDKGCIDKTAID